MKRHQVVEFRGRRQYLVTLSAGQLAWVEETARQALHDTDRLDNATGMKNPNRFHVGKAGELAFGVILTDLSIRFEYQQGQAGWDYAAGDERLDVNTSERYHHRTQYLNVNVVMAERRQAVTMYVGAAWWGPATVRFFGWSRRAEIMGAEVREWQPGYPTHSIQERATQSMDALWAML